MLSRLVIDVHDGAPTLGFIRAIVSLKANKAPTGTHGSRVLLFGTSVTFLHEHIDEDIYMCHAAGSCHPGIAFAFSGQYGNRGKRANCDRTTRRRSTEMPGSTSAASYRRPYSIRFG